MGIPPIVRGFDQFRRPLSARFVEKEETKSVLGAS